MPKKEKGQKVAKKAAIRISAMQFAAPGPGKKNILDEWVELEGRNVDMTGFTLHDRAARRIYIFPEGFILNGYVKIITGRGKDTKRELYWNSGSPVWRDEGDIAILRDKRRRIICKQTAAGSWISEEGLEIEDNLPDEPEIEEAEETRRVAGEKLIDRYKFKSINIPIEITIKRISGEYVPIYAVNIAEISQSTMIVLEKIREKLVEEVNLGIVDIRAESENVAEERFEKTIHLLIKKHFPGVSEHTKDFLTTYLIQRSLGLGHLEILNDDPNLEEIVVNSAKDPVWVYHKKHGWLKTNIELPSEERVRYYAAAIGRKVGKQISVLEPLLDAHLAEGDRVNATLFPISTAGNTITLRRFSREPWTIAHMMEFGTISADAAAFIWAAIQYEMSAIIAGGTASGKTSMLNVLANFFPPNQRIISIEDTREIKLPKFLHWVPMSTRLPNVEGRGKVTMEDLLVNSLRMRPDRIIVGEVRRSREAETLFEAIHTGHSCYATFHANDVRETINRLTNPPINVPSTLLPAISLIVVQYRNRRNGLRRTFQIAEIGHDSKARILKQYDARRDVLQNVNKSRTVINQLALYTGKTMQELKKDMEEKGKILKWIVKQQVKDVDHVGMVMAEYYTDPKNLMSYVNKGKKFKR
ncbi:MAG: ATPase, T2SS/T4P/T4SS family [Candidatus Nanoarchaeia archaeon]